MTTLDIRAEHIRIVATSFGVSYETLYRRHREGLLRTIWFGKKL